MKGKEHEPLVLDNLKRFREHLKAGKSVGDYEGVLAMLADIVDSAGNGHECWCTFGLSRGKEQVMMTIHYGPERLFASGSSLVEVSKACIELL